MQLSVKGKQLDVGGALRRHVSDSLTTIAAKYFSKPIEASVVFSREAHLYRADLSAHVGRNILLQSNAEATDPYRAFDAAADKMSKRLRRQKRRLKDHHKGNGTAPRGEATAPRDEAIAAPVDDDAADQPVIVAEMAMPVDTMSVSEAAARLDRGALPALLFRNGGHGGLNMIYRRPDGHIGWVDPRGIPRVGA